MTSRLSVNVPFAGFYDSWYSDEIDRQERMFVENEFEEGREPVLDEQDLYNLLLSHTPYGIAYQRIARDYVDAFALAAKGLDLTLEFEFEEMTSPREYNFETDRLFATLPLAALQDMLTRSAAENHKTLAAVIAERHTSRSGFHSFYRNDLESWLEKPLEDWDHNETGTLLRAALLMAGADRDFEFEIFQSMADGAAGCFYTAWENAVDWESFEKAREELRAEKAETAHV